MRKKTTRRIRQSIVAGVVGVACIFGCENLEVAFAETATVTDATAEDATAGENDDDTDIESAETMFVGDTYRQMRRELMQRRWMRMMKSVACLS